MTTANIDVTPRKSLRLWPAVVIVTLQWLGWLLVPLVVPGSGGSAMLGAAAGGLAVLLWWLFFSRAPWADRVGFLLLMVGGVMAAKQLVHPSVANAGMGMLVYIFALPVMSLALVASAAAARRLPDGPRRAVMVAGILLGCAAFTLVRTGGVSGDSRADLHWRWTPTPEERLLAQAADQPVPRPAEPSPIAPGSTPGVTPSLTPGADPSAPPASNASAPAPSPASAQAAPAAAAPAATKSAAWPGFRGPSRDGAIPGVHIATDWAKSPPVQLWRRPIGPGWSSFAVQGDLIYTQEQRGEEEVVSCYSLSTGQPVWRHADAARFYESNGGAGPRATPTLSHGRAYTLGATGILNALDAATGARAWSRNAATDTGAKDPGWGFSGSPLVVGDMVVVATSGRLAAYDAGTGQPRWMGPEGGAGYSSPHLVTIDGIPQILLLRGARSTSVSPTDGSVLWEHKAKPGVSIVQPAITADGNILIAPGDGMGGAGILRLAVAHGPAGWTLAERWTSRGLKPYFNDFVVHKGHAFGFDSSILASIDLADGTRKWKGGRYGLGQMILLPRQDLLLVLSEEGELALVKATPDQFTEVARVPGIEGKTWNHPVLVGDILLVRNGEEMAAFRLPLEAPRTAGSPVGLEAPGEHN